MNLGRLIVLFMFGFGVVLVGILLFSANMVMLPRYAEMEQSLFEVNMDRLEAMITDRFGTMAGVVTSWATWDGAYEFVQTQDEAFIENELLSETLVTSGLNLMAYLDEDGDVIVIKSVDLETEEEVNYVEFSALLTERNASFRFADPTDHHEGLLWADGMMWLVAAGPVIKSNTEGPVKGSLVVGMALTPAMLERLGTSWQYLFDLRPWREYKLVKSEQALLQEGQLVTKIDGEASVTGHRLLEDYFGEKSAALTLIRDRDVYQRGVASIRSYTLIVGFSVIGGIMVIMMASHQFIARPFRQLITQLREIETAHDFGRRIQMKASADFVRVGSSINAVLKVNERLAQTAAANAESLEQQLGEMEAGYKELEQTKLAMMNILEDQRELEEQLKLEKEAVEERVVERTRELAEEQAKLKGSIANLPVGFLLVNQNGTVAMTNAQLTQIVPGTVEADVAALVRTWLVAGEVMTAETETILPNKLVELRDIDYKGKYIAVSVTPVQVQENDRVEQLGWVVLVTDITQEKMLQRSRDEFFSIASHELRTPLTAIRGNAAMIRDYSPELMKDKELAQSIDDIHAGAVRLIQIVNDFLDASRLELGKITYDIGAVELVGMVKKVMEAMQATAAEKKIGWVFEQADEGEIMVRADKSRVEQVLYNLIGNALKFTKEGEVRVELLREQTIVKVRIIDSGAGIPAENHQLLFKKFQQAGESVYTRDVSQGSGMGLYISRLLARGMGGDIALERSEPEKGSVFLFTLQLMGDEPVREQDSG